jgi:hypothetical protein
MLQPNVIAVTPLQDYKLLVEYATGEKKIFDVKPYIMGEWFGQLKDENVFKTVHPCGTTVEWADGQDIAPHELYDLSVAVGGV